MRIKPHQIYLDDKGRPHLKPRFRRTKHRGYQAGAFGRPTKL